MRSLLVSSFLLGILAPAAAGQGFSPGNLFVSDGSGSILEFTPNGTFVRSFTSVADFGGGAARGLAFRPDGNLEAAAEATDKLVTFDPTGAKVGETAGAGLDSPFGLAIGPNGERWVASRDTQEVFVYDVAGATRRTFTGGNTPADLAFGPTGHLFVADEGDDVVHEFDPDGESVEDRNPGVASAPFGAAFSPDGRLHVTIATPPSVVVLDETGVVATITDPDLTTPRDLAFGFDGRLYVANENPPLVVRFKFTPGNTMAQTIADPAMTAPLFLAFAPARFRAKTTGTRFSGNTIASVKDAYDLATSTGPVLSLSPEGALLWSGDDAADPADLASALGATQAAFRGVSFGDGSTWIFAGTQTSVFGDLLGSLSLTAKMDSGGGGATPKSLKGLFSFQGADLLVSGKAKGKALP